MHKIRKAQDIMEWTLIVALVSIIIMGVLFVTGTQLRHTYNTIISTLQAAEQPAP